MQAVLKSIFFIAGLSLILIGCERVITVDIKKVPAKYVVEGVLNDDSTCWVRFSKTNAFDDTISLLGLSRARITISEEGGETAVLTETTGGRGIYRARFSGHPGRTYHLKVEYDAPSTDEQNEPHQVFTATSTMPQKVTLDSLFITERIFLGQKRLIGTIRYQDPPAPGNAYRYVQYIDGSEETTVFVTKDDLFNGRMVTDELLIFNSEYTLRKCDQLRVVLQCIETPIYKFWYSMNQSSLGSSQSASPDNPASNIQGGALGYFSAHTVSAKNIAVFPDSTCSYPAN